MDVAEVKALWYRNLGNGGECPDGFLAPVALQAIPAPRSDFPDHGVPHKTAGDEAMSSSGAWMGDLVESNEDALAVSCSITGLATPVNMSHRMLRPFKGRAFSCKLIEPWKVAMFGQDSCALGMDAQSSCALAVAQTTATIEGEEVPTMACKAAAEDPEGAFISDAAEAGPEGVEEEGAGCCGNGGGLDIVSATTLLTPEMCWMFKVYSAM
jgi:hypothetical protein